MLSVELNDRERPASPGPSPLLERKAAAAVEPPDASKPKQWRIKIEQWLQENEKEQEKERKLRDKIALERLRRQEIEQKENDTSPQIEDKNDDWKRVKSLATLHEVKTDSEIYANKAKTIKQSEHSTKSPELPENVPLKDKSKWRKSNLNVANSTESIDDERRRSRSRRNASDPETDTISFYIRGNNSQSAESIMQRDRIENPFSNNPLELQSSEVNAPHLSNSMYATPTGQTDILANETPQQNEERIHKMDSKLNNSTPNVFENQPEVLIGRSRFYKSMKDPSYDNIEQKSHKHTNSVADTDSANDINKNEIKPNDEETKHMSSDKDEEGNFDRFSYMRKTTRRAKSKNKAHDNESQKTDDLNSDVTTNNDIQRTVKPSEHDTDINTKCMEEALREINQSSREIQNLANDKVKSSGNLFTKYIGDNKNGEEEQKKKDKSTSLKARLSKRLLSLTENLKVVAKPLEATDLSGLNLTKSATEDKKHNLISESTCPKIEKMLSERRASLNDEKPNPIMEHREKILSRPLQEMVQVPVRNKLPQSPTESSPIMIVKPQFIKESYVSDINNVKIAHATPVTHEIKELESYPPPKCKDECEKDEGFEETQSQLSEAASQGAGSNYDTDLADSPRSVRQVKNQIPSKANQPPETIVSNIASRIPDSDDSNQVNNKTNLVTEKTEKPLLPTQSFKPNGNEFNRSLRMKKSDDRTTEKLPGKMTALPTSSSRSTAVPDKKIPRQSVPLSRSSFENKNISRPQTSVNARSSLRNSQESVSSSGSRITRKSGLKEQENSQKTTSASGSRQIRRLNSKEKSNSQESVSNTGSKKLKKPSLKELGNLSETSPKIGRRVAAYTKAIKSMTNNLRGSKKFENYDVTQSMPPTPSEEKKTFTSGLNSVENGKKARSSSSVFTPRSQSRRSSERSINSPLGLSSRRGSEKSISSKKSSERSLSLSRKSSEASVVTVKSANRSPMSSIRRPKHALSSQNRLNSSVKAKTQLTRPDNSVQAKHLRVPTSIKPVTRSNSATKPTTSAVPAKTTVRRTSSDKSSCAFMRATSASSAKVTPTKTVPEQKLKTHYNQKISKPIQVTKVEPSPNGMKQRY